MSCISWQQTWCDIYSVPLEQQCWWSKCKSGSLICCQVSMWSFGKVQRAWGADWKGTVNMRCMPNGERVGCACEAFVSFWTIITLPPNMGSNPWGWWRTPQPRSYNWHFLHKFWLWMICGDCSSLEVSAIDSDCSWEHQALLQCVHN
jgi:hypothetical protein